MAWCRAIRGATVVPENTREHIIAASKELLQETVDANGVEIGDIVCIFFTSTVDLNAAFPAAAARELGWTQVPLLCTHEMDVPGSMARCLRILLLFNTGKKGDQVVHVYLRGTERLRTETDES